MEYSLLNSSHEGNSVRPYGIDELALDDPDFDFDRMLATLDEIRKEERQRKNEEQQSRE